MDQLAHRRLQLALQSALAVFDIVLDLAVVLDLSIVILEELLIFLSLGPNFVLILPSDVDLLGVDLEV